MSETVQRVIEGTFVILILMWVLTRSSEFGAVVSSIGTAYTGAINALKPSNA